jgi:hypothetical protein
MQEINNDEIIEFLIQKYPVSFEDKMEKKMKKFEKNMESPTSAYYVGSIIPSKNNNSSWCFSKLLMWLIIFLIVIFMGVMICKK